MKKISFARRLKLMDACEEAVEWVGRKSMKTAWNTCENPFWMMWLLEETVKDGSDEHRRVVLCACDFANRSADLAACNAEFTVASAARNAVWNMSMSMLWSLEITESEAMSACCDIIRKHFPACPLMEKRK